MNNFGELIKTTASQLMDIRSINFVMSESMWDVIYKQFTLKSISSGVSVLSKQISVKTTDLTNEEVIATLSPDVYIFTSTTGCIAYNDDLLFSIFFHDNSSEFQLYGSPDAIKNAINDINNVFDPNVKFIKWVYDPVHMESVSLPIKMREIIHTAYPWIKKPLSQYFDEYLASDASILILVGPPGTGKTTFIKHIINYSKETEPAIVTYDSHLIDGDSFFASFMSDNKEFLIIEDADTILDSRDEGNTLMHRFLNMGDGIITTRKKKIIFSTNLPNVRSIDPALLRPGRCYDILNFRELSVPEANAVLEEVGIDKKITGSVSLANLLNEKIDDSWVNKQTIGFI